MPAPKGHPPYNVNGEGGRPLEWTDERIDKVAIQLEQWLEIEDKNNIFIEKFCLDHDYAESCVSKHFTRSERFRNAYDKLRSKQKLSLFIGGLNKKHYFPMAQLLLSYNHDINLKTEQKLSGTINQNINQYLNNIDGSSSEIVNDSI